MMMTFLPGPLGVQMRYLNAVKGQQKEQGGFVVSKSLTLRFAQRSGYLVFFPAPKTLLHVLLEDVSTRARPTKTNAKTDVTVASE